MLNDIVHVETIKYNF